MEKIKKERFWLLCMLTNVIVRPLKKTSCLQLLNSKKNSFKAKHFYLTKNPKQFLSLHPFEGELLDVNNR